MTSVLFTLGSSGSAPLAIGMLSILSTGLLSTGLVASYRHPLPLQRLAVRARALSMAENDQGVEYAVQKSDAEWREGLSDMEYQVLRLKGTERPGTGEYRARHARRAGPRPPGL